MKIKKVCVVGIGVMGTGIVQICAQAGYATSVVGRREQSLERGLGKIKNDLTRLAKKGQMEQEEVDRIVDAITANATTSLKEGAKEAEFVIQAVK